MTDSEADPDGSGPVQRTGLQLAHRWSPEVVAALYRRHGAACYRLARWVTGSDVVAEDVVFEVFAASWRDPGACPAGPGGMGGWLLAQTHRRAVRAARRQPTRLRRQSAAAVRRALDRPGRGLAAGDSGLAAGLAGLPRAQRQALALAYLGGYTQREIAQLTGIPLEAVRAGMLATMRQLHARITPFGGPVR